jgi:hypothetical protein
MIKQWPNRATAQPDVMKKKGDRYYIPSGVKHFGKIYAGYADITFFNQSDRYSEKNKKS